MERRRRRGAEAGQCEQLLPPPLFFLKFAIKGEELRGVWFATHGHEVAQEVEEQSCKENLLQGTHPRFVSDAKQRPRIKLRRWIEVLPARVQGADHPPFRI